MGSNYDPERIPCYLSFLREEDAKRLCSALKIHFDPDASLAVLKSMIKKISKEEIFQTLEKFNFSIGPIHMLEKKEEERNSNSDLLEGNGGDARGAGPSATDSQAETSQLNNTVHYSDDEDNSFFTPTNQNSKQSSQKRTSSLYRKSLAPTTNSQKQNQPNSISQDLIDFQSGNFNFQPLNNVLSPPVCQNNVSDPDNSLLNPQLNPFNFWSNFNRLPIQTIHPIFNPQNPANMIFFCNNLPQDNLNQNNSNPNNSQNQNQASQPPHT